MDIQFVQHLSHLKLLLNLTYIFSFLIKFILSKRKKERIIEQKCQYCGKIFDGNKKQIYCCSECAKKANSDKTSKRNSYRWYNDIEFRKRLILKYGQGVGTIVLSDNKDNDWEKELIRIRALKKQAGLNRRA